MAWRDTKRKMRWGVHCKMSAPALYLMNASSEGVLITVRGPEYKINRPVGAAQGFEGTAEREDTQPALLFWVDELTEKNIVFKQGEIISFKPGEAYRLGPIPPVLDEVIKIDVIPLTASQSANLAVPA